MRVSLEVESSVFKEEKGIRVRLKYSSSKGERFLIDRMFYGEQPKDFKQRVLDDMFRELQTRALEVEI